MHSSDNDSSYAASSDAFGPVTLESFALNPTGAHLLRAQHEQLLRLAGAVTTLVEAGLDSSLAGCTRALGARNNLTTLLSLVSVHQSLEESMLRRALATDPRIRLSLEQFEREIAPLLSELASLSRRYPTPSSIVDSDFAPQFASWLAKLSDRFRAEERDLFPAYDRVVKIAAPGGAMLAAAA